VCASVSVCERAHSHFFSTDMMRDEEARKLRGEKDNQRRI
jgi:hypothetical protein